MKMASMIFILLYSPTSVVAVPQQKILTMKTMVNKTLISNTVLNIESSNA